MRVNSIADFQQKIAEVKSLMMTHGETWPRVSCSSLSNPLHADER